MCRSFSHYSKRKENFLLLCKFYCCVVVCIILVFMLFVFVPGGLFTIHVRSYGYFESFVRLLYLHACMTLRGDVMCVVGYVACAVGVSLGLCFLCVVSVSRIGFLLIVLFSFKCWFCILRL